MYEQFYQDKQKEIVANYIDDKLCGEYIKYNSWGGLIEKANYNMGVLCGIRYLYESNLGYIKCTEINYDNGKINGEYIEYYKCHYDSHISIYNYTNYIYSNDKKH